MSIIIVIAIGIAILLVLLFFAVNRWSSFGRDRAKTADLRSNRQTTTPGTDERGTGIN